MKTKRFMFIRSAAAMAPLAFLLWGSVAVGQEVQVQPRVDTAVPEANDVSETGKKLSNPLGDVWALFTEFDLSSSDGSLNPGHQQTGGRMTFQPILPIPLYGTGENEWKLITRPTIPFLFRQPIPEGSNSVNQKAGIGDIQLPLIISPPVKNWILGAGPTLLFPSATDSAFGRHQWGAGPAVVVGHYSEKVTMGVFPQYFFGVKSQGFNNNLPKASYMNLLYFMYYNMPNGWQVGFSPIATWDRRASAGNRWNVPVGMGVSKTARVGGMIAKFELGFEYSVVSENAFGQRAMIKLNVIPVIPSLIRRPLLGGR
jgi:hypothetical protein